MKSAAVKPYIRYRSTVIFSIAAMASAIIYMFLRVSLFPRPLPVNDVKQASFHYITVATQDDPVLQVLRESTERSGVTLEVLGLQEQRGIGWSGTCNFGVKLREVSHYINDPAHFPDDIVLFSDSYDVCFVGDKETVLKRYLEFGKPVVFSAETSCHPDAWMSPEYPTENLKEFFPYLNSGGFIGTIRHLRILMSEYVYHDTDDDQRYWTTQYMRNSDLIALDHKSAIFLTSLGVLNKTDIRIEDGIIMYQNKTPQVVHAHGPDKSRHLKPFLDYAKSKR